MNNSQFLNQQSIFQCLEPSGKAVMQLLVFEQASAPPGVGSASADSAASWAQHLRSGVQDLYQGVAHV